MPAMSISRPCTRARLNKTILPFFTFQTHYSAPAILATQAYNHALKMRT